MEDIYVIILGIVMGLIISIFYRQYIIIKRLIKRIKELSEEVEKALVDDKIDEVEFYQIWKKLKEVIDDIKLLMESIKEIILVIKKKW